jgi:hypothetical protein
MMPVEEAEQVVDVALTPGQRGSRIAASVESGLDTMLSSTGRIEGQREGVFSGMDQYLQELLPGATTREAAGDTVRSGVTDFVTNRRAKENEVFSGVEQALIDAGGSTKSRINTGQLDALGTQWRDLIAQDEEFARLVYNDPEVVSAINAAEAFAGRREQYDALRAQGFSHNAALEQIDGPLTPTYEVIKRLRTKIGKKMDDNFLTFTGSTRDALNRLYGVLSDDLARGAFDIGGEGAVQARSRANWVTRGLSQRLEAIDPIFKNSDNPTDIYQKLATSLTNNPTMAAAAKKSMSQDEWDTFADTYLNQATRATPGQQDAAGTAFSPSTTLTNLSRLKRTSPEGYDLLVGDKREALDAVLVLAENLRDAERVRNSSQTARAHYMQNLLSPVTMGGGMGGASYLFGGGNLPQALAVGGLSMGVSAAIPYLTSLVMTNPTASRAITKVARSRDVLPVGRDLVRALSAAGLDEQGTAGLMQAMGIEQETPLRYGEELTGE